MDIELNLSIQSGNAAFDNGNGRAECVRILRDVAKKLENGHNACQLHDYNGNKVGRFSFHEDDES